MEMTQQQQQQQQQSMTIFFFTNEEIVPCVVAIENMTRQVAHPRRANKATKCPRVVQLL
jgi:hypothetical protein